MSHNKRSNRSGERPSAVRTTWVLTLGLAAALLGAPAALRAATYTWDGGGNGVGNAGNFHLKQNWGNASGAPGAITDDLVFTSVVGSSSTPTLTTDEATHSITFNAGAAAFTIGGAGSVLTIGSGGIVNNSSNTEAFSVGSITLAAAQTWLAASGNLSFSGLAITNAGFTLTIDGAQNTSISAAISGTGGLTKTGAGILTLSNVGNTYSGTTQLVTGTLLFAASNVLGSGALDVSGGTLDLASFSDTVGAVTLTGGSINGVGGVLTGTIYDLRSGSVSAMLGGAGVGLTKSTAGTVNLSGANTYTGATTVSVGTLALTSTGSINSASSLTIGAGATFQTASAFSLASRSLEIGVASASSNGFLNDGGALTYGGTIKFTISGTYAVQSWNLLDFTSRSGHASSVILAGSYGGSLVRTGDLWTGVVGGAPWSFNEADGVLSVPEPSSWVTLLGGLGAMLGFQRMRRRF